MASYQVTLPNRQTIELPERTIKAIEDSKFNYAAPLWQFRSERVLKLGSHQWIYPNDPNTARVILAAHPLGIVAMAWKLFNRGWSASAEAYFLDGKTYPNQPRHWGRNVIPLVDEDNDSQQIGWVRINQYSEMDHNFAIFVEFTLLELFEPRVLPSEYQ